MYYIYTRFAPSATSLLPPRESANSGSRASRRRKFYSLRKNNNNTTQETVSIHRNAGTTSPSFLYSSLSFFFVLLSHTLSLSLYSLIVYSATDHCGEPLGQQPLVHSLARFLSRSKKERTYGIRRTRAILFLPPFERADTPSLFLSLSILCCRRGMQRDVAAAAVRTG